MTTHESLPSEVAEERQELISELNAELGSDWQTEYAPGSAGCHELLDRAHLVADMLERFVVEHPACVRDPEWYQLARQATDTLHDLYQQVGAAHLADESPAA